MSKTNPIYAFLSHNKYWLVLIVGVLIVGFFDENSFVQRIKYDMEISELEAQIDKCNPKAITKIARERYFMKADDEDIFVLSDDMYEPTPLPHEAAE